MDNEHQICDLWIKTVGKMDKECQMCDLWIKTVGRYATEG